MKKGNCNYFTARSYSGDWLSYKNPPASKNIIFNDLLIDWNKPITLVEGPFDSIKMSNSIPILGSTLKETTKLFKKIAEKQTKVFIGLDEDALSKSMKIISLLLEYGLDVYKDKHIRDRRHWIDHKNRSRRFKIGSVPN